MPLYREPKSPHWWVRISVAGRKVKKSTSTDVREEAEEFERVLRDRLWRIHKLGDRSAVTFAEVCKRWLAETHKRTKHQDEVALAWFQKAMAADAAVGAIDADMIEQLRSKLLSLGMGKSTVDRNMAILRAVLRRCLEWGYLTHVPKVPMFRQPAPEPRWLTPTEFSRLCKELPKHLELAARFAVLTGLRMSSMLRLTWDRVDLSAARAWVPASQMKAGKTHGVPLSLAAVKVLRELRSLHPEGDYVFQYDGHRVADCNTAAFQKAVSRCGLSPLRWHDLRHTFASWAVQGRVPLAEIQSLGGWQTLAMVQRYAHLAPDHLAQAAARVAEIGATRKKAKRASR